MNDAKWRILRTIEFNTCYATLHWLFIPTTFSPVSLNQILSPFRCIDVGMGSIAQDLTADTKVCDTCGGMMEKRIERDEKSNGEVIGESVWICRDCGDWDA